MALTDAGQEAAGVSLLAQTARRGFRVTEAVVWPCCINVSPIKIQNVYMIANGRAVFFSQPIRRPETVPLVYLLLEIGVGVWG